MNRFRRMWATVLSAAMIISSSSFGSVNVMAAEGDIQLSSNEDVIMLEDSTPSEDSENLKTDDDILTEAEEDNSSLMDDRGLKGDTLTDDNQAGTEVLVTESDTEGNIYKNKSDEGSTLIKEDDRTVEKETAVDTVSTYNTGEKGVKVGDLHYALTPQFAAVIGWEPSKPEGLMDVTIPSYIIPEDGYEREVVAIADGAFAETEEETHQLRSVIFKPSEKNPSEGSSVKIIGERAFADCTMLKSVEFPKDMTRTDVTVYGFGMIGSRAFEGCTSLAKVTLPEKLDIVGEAVFAECTSLTSVEIPSGWATTVVQKDKEDVTKGKDNIKDVIKALDSKLNEAYKARSPFSDCETLTTISFAKGTQGVATSMLADCDSIKSIEIPDSVTSIGKKAFYECDNLEEVILRSSSKLNRIEDLAFQKCKSLKAAMLPKYTDTIGTRAFIECTSMTETIIPYSVSTIGDYAYSKCINLESISFGDGVYTEVTGGYIGKYAFGDTPNAKKEYENALDKIESVTIPNSITRIGESAFEGCSGLSTLIFENRFADFSDRQSILKKAFYNCTSLSEVTFPENSNVELIGESAFENCYALATLTLPNSVKELGGAAFKSCTSLSTLKLSERLATLGQSAFNGCISLTDLSIPMSITKVGPNISNGTVTDKELDLGVFRGSGLQNVTFVRYNKKDVGDEKADGYRIPNNILLGAGQVKSIIMPEGDTTVIGDFAFAGCKSLEKINIPNSCVEICGGAFGLCSLLGRHPANEGPYTLVIPANVTSIGRAAFMYCYLLEEVQLPASLRSLGEGLGDGAFESCRLLREIRIPDTVTEIGEGTFKNCEKLATVTLPKGTSQIDNELFSGCKALTTVNNVSKDYLTKIGNSAFANCEELTSFDESGTIDFSEYKKLYSIGKNAFDGCSAVTTVTLSAATATLGDYVFANCTKLANVTIGTGPKEIPGYAFAKDQGLIAITIPRNVKTIKANAFNDVTNLTEIHIPKDTEIEEGWINKYSDILTIYGSDPSPAKNYADSHKIKFEKEIIYATSVKFTDNSDKVINIKKKADIPGIDVKPENYSVDVNYISGDENVFTIEEYQDNSTKELKHRINAVGVGKARLTVQVPKDADGNMLTDSFMVTVKNPVKSLTAGKDASGRVLNQNQTINMPNNLQLTVTVNLEDATADVKGLTDLTCTWVSNDRNVCRVESNDEGCLVHPTGVGTTQVIATSNDDPDKTYAYNITVTHNVLVEGIKFPNAEETVAEGDKLQLKPVITPEDATDKTVSYKSGNTKIATVDDNGLVSGISVGTALVTVTTTDGKKTDTCKINVVKPSDYVPVTKVSFVKSTVALYEGNAFQLEIKIEPDNATDKTVSYKSSNTQVATVDEKGLIKAVKAGTANITVTTNGEKKTATCAVTVYQDEDPDPSSDEFVWEFDDTKRTATLIKWNGNVSGNAVIPSEAINEDHPDYQDDGKRKVVSIAKDAFKGKKANIVKLPDTLETIQSEAFNGCLTLPSIEIPDSVTEIQAKAFNNCAALESVTLPKNLAKLGNSVFNGCTSLTSIELPACVSTVEVKPSSKEGPFTGSSIKIIAFAKGTNKLADNLFLGFNSLESLKFPESVTTIGKGTFKYCTNLKEIDIYEMATSIGDSAFEGCTSLESVKIPKYIETVGANEFKDCTALLSVSIPHSATSVGNSAFENCTSLEEFTFRPENKADGCALGNAIFKGCTSLESIEIPESIGVISPNAFENCTALLDVKLPEGLVSINGSAFKNCVKLGEGGRFTIHNNVKTIGANAFDGCIALYDIALSTGLETIGANAFKGSAIESITLPKSIKTVQVTVTDEKTGIFYECEKLKAIGFEEGITSIPANLLLGCGSIEVITVPATVTSIGNSAFRYCRKLNRVEMSGDLQTIGDYAFAECDVLGQPIDGKDNVVRIPSGVKSIGNSAFAKCGLLKKTELPTGLEKIGNSAYNSCKSLQEIVIPATVTSVGTSCFEGCAALKKVTLPETTTEIPASEFKDCVKLAMINLPKALITIGANAFDNCDALGDDTLNFSEYKALKSIGKEAFANCDAFSKVVLSSTTATLGEGAFKNCAKLSDITLGTGLSTIPAYAFAELASLANMTIPSNVATIADYAFWNDQKLTEIHIPKTTLSIGGKAFSYKDKLTIYGVKGSEAQRYADADPDIKFEEETVPVETIKFTEAKYRVDRGADIDLPIPEVVPVNYSEDLSFSSSDDKKFTVVTDEKSGKKTIHGVETGEATLTVTTSDTKKTATTTIEVTEPVMKVTINGKDKSGKIQLKVNSKTKLSVTIEPETAYDKSLIWESSKDDIVYVDKDGVASALKEGTAIITVKTNNGKTDKCTIDVVEDDLKEDVVIGQQKAELTANISTKDIIAKDKKILFRCTPSYNSHIYYTLDGNKPKGDYTGKHLKGTFEYTEPFTLSENAIINVKAVAYGYQSKEETYNITVDEWGDIGKDRGDVLFKGNSDKIPENIWYAFKGDNTPYNPSSSTQVTTVSKNYTGKRIMFNEEISVFYGREQLVEGRDYRVSYSNNINPARASAEGSSPTVTIKGTGEYYKGSSKFAFTITETTPVAAKIRVECLNKEPEYTGSDFTLDSLGVSLYDESEGGKTKLILGEDYKLISAPGKFGTFTLKFELLKKGGTVESDPITVKPYDVKKHIKAGDKDINIDFNKSTDFCKAGATPKVTVKFKSDELREGVDYKVKYSKNKKYGKKAKLKISFIGCFKGTVTDYFEIVNKKDVSQLDVYAEDIKWTNKPGNFKVQPQVLDNGKAVSKRKDIEKFSKTLRCEYYDIDGNKIADNAVVVPDSIIKVEVEVISRAKGPYKNKAKISGFYCVYSTDKDIKKAKVSPKPIILDYDEGNEIVPMNITDFTLTMPGMTDCLESEYFEIVSITQNRFIGTASVTLRGRNGYGGTKRFKAKIQKRKM